jgi:hypothetical protein
MFFNANVEILVDDGNIAMTKVYIYIFSICHVLGTSQQKHM